MIFPATAITKQLFIILNLTSFILIIPGGFDLLNFEGAFQAIKKLR